MLNVVVLTGGSSPEREVSLRSGAAVAAALEKSGHNVDIFDTVEPVSDALLLEADVVFPVMHGEGGEDGSLQQHLEQLGIHHYVGSDYRSSTLCFNKQRHTALLRDNGIATPKNDLISGNVQAHELVQKPFVLKPYNGGSSVDTFIVRSPAEADFAAMEAAVQTYGHMLLEELVEGTEITVGVIDGQALPVIEIIPPKGGEFDYKNKYNGATQELCPPKNISEQLQLQAQRLAVTIHELCGCRDMSRTDMIITADDALYVLETNTIPGMTDQSLLPKAAIAAGMTMPQLCDRLAQAAAKRRTGRA